MRPSSRPINQFKIWFVVSAGGIVWGLIPLFFLTCLVSLSDALECTNAWCYFFMSILHLIFFVFYFVSALFVWAMLDYSYQTLHVAYDEE